MVSAIRAMNFCSVLMFDNMKQIITNVFYGLIIAAALDLMILFAALGQIAIEGRTGEWNGFWLVQAKAVVAALNWLSHLV